MGLRSSAIRAIGKGFDIERRVKQSPVTQIVLLRRDGVTNPYSALKTYASGFIFRFNQFRNQSEIEIATEDDLSTDAMNLMGVAAISGGSGPIYMVQNADVVPPDDDRFTWIFYGVIRPKEVYTVV